ncbi:hypothetical protein BDQ17DRAFT_1330398 [Cyathus striatus]|nr:hypothetical protein BDQ17DRAFT_1330398 [Cyathus striatus]
MDSPVQTIRVLIEHMQNVTYLHVAALTLCVFENLITMDMEVAYIWKSSNWSVVKVLYIFVSCLNIVVQLFPSLSPEACKSLYYILIWAISIGVTASEIWNKTRNMAIVLTLLFIGVLVSVYAGDGMLGTSFKFELQDLLRTRGCIVTSAEMQMQEEVTGLMLAYITGEN